MILEYASLNIVVGGGITERIGRGERRYVRGHASFCPVGVTHSQDFGDEGARQIIFRPQDSWLDYLRECKLDLSDSPFTGSIVFQHLGDQLRDELQSDDAFSAMACEGLMLEIVAAFGRSGTASTNAAEPPAWPFKRARDFLHENVSETLSMTRIAQREAGRHRQISPKHASSNVSSACRSAIICGASRQIARRSFWPNRMPTSPRSRLPAASAQATPISAVNSKRATACDAVAISRARMLTAKKSRDVCAKVEQLRRQFRVEHWRARGGRGCVRRRWLAQRL